MIKDTDHGFIEFMKAIKGLDRTTVLVGVQQFSKAQKPDLFTIAMVQEFGSPRQKIPERSFLRGTVTKYKGKYVKYLQRSIERAMDAVLTGGAAACRSVLDHSLELLGAQAVGDIQQRISSRDFVPNAPSTIAQKGSSTPLVDSGRLRQSIDWRVERGS